MGVVGKIKRVNERIDRLRRNRFRITPDAFNAELAAISNDLRNIMTQLDDERDRRLLIDSLSSDVMNGVPELKRELLSVQPETQMILEDFEESDLLQLPPP